MCPAQSVILGYALSFGTSMAPNILQAVLRLKHTWIAWLPRHAQLGVGQETWPARRSLRFYFIILLFYTVCDLQGPTWQRSQATVVH